MREALSFDEDELKSVDARHEYICSYRDMVDGKPVRCDNSGFFPSPPVCAEHGMTMEPSGQITFDLSPEMQAREKEIHMGPQALSIASNALKRLNDQRKLTEAHISLYEKFFPPEEKDVG